MVTAVEIVEFKIDIDSGSREALGVFRFDNLRITVMCYSSGDTSDKPKETVYKVTCCWSSKCKYHEGVSKVKYYYILKGD